MRTTETTRFGTSVPATCAALLAVTVLVSAPVLAANPTPADHLSRAQAALADGMYASAEQHLVKVLALNRASVNASDCRTALALLCQTYASLRRYNDIISLLDRNAGVIDAGDRRVFDYWRANALIESGDITGALKLIDPDMRIAAKTNDTANLQLVSLAAEAYSRLDQPDALVRAEEMIDFFLLNAPQIDPAPLPLSDTKLLQARLMARGGKRDKAAAAFKTLADDDSIGTFIRASAMLEYVRLSETNAATTIEYANRLSRLPLGKAASDYVIPCGSILASRRDTAEAGARYLTQAVRDNPTSPLAPEAQLAIAEAWFSANSNVLAAAEFKKYLETYGTTPEETSRATAGRAEALYRLGQYSEAATLFQKAADTPSDLARSVLDMRAADALYAEGKYEAAAALYYDISCRDHTMTGHEYGIQLLKNSYPEEATADALGFILNRTDFMSADSLERCGKTDEALKRFDSIASAKSTGQKNLFSDEALYRAALLLERQDDGIGSNQGAIERFSTLISDPDTNDQLRRLAFLARGRCHYRNKSLDIAISDFAKAEEGGLDSADEATMYHVYALYGLGQNKEAVRLAESFVGHDSDSPILPTLAFWLAQYFYTARNFSESANRFSLFAEKWPDDIRAPRALLWAAKSDLRQSENQKALDTLAALGNRYSGSDVIPEARFTQAKVLCNLARFEEAVTVIDNATANFPDSVFTTRALILKGDAIFSLFGTEKTVYSVTNALAAYEIAGNRPDATLETQLECNFKKGRCFEKGGEANTVAKFYYDNVITPFYAHRDKGNVSPQGVSFYERAVFACARLREQAGEIEGALEILRRLREYNTPDRAHAEQEIDRIENGKE